MAAAWSAANAATRHNEKFRMPGLNGFALSLPSYEQDFGPSFTMKEMRAEKDTDHHGGGGHCTGNSSCLGSASGRWWRPWRLARRNEIGRAHVGTPVTNAH